MFVISIAAVAEWLSRRTRILEVPGWNQAWECLNGHVPVKLRPTPNLV